jgi:hypothetical protein
VVEKVMTDIGLRIPGVLIGGADLVKRSQLPGRHGLAPRSQPVKGAAARAKVQRFGAEDGGVALPDVLR